MNIRFPFFIVIVKHVLRNNHYRNNVLVFTPVISATTKVILDTNKLVSASDKDISATTKVILDTAEVITSPLKFISATTKVILATKEAITHTLKVI